MIEVIGELKYPKTRARLERLAKGDVFKKLGKYGQRGVNALQKMTPVDSGLTAASWAYKIVQRRGTYTIVWYNTNVNEGANIAILIQYGHGTGTGGYVQGRDYINPAMRPIFDQISADITTELRRR